MSEEEESARPLRPMNIVSEEQTAVTPHEASTPLVQSSYYEGERFTNMLQSIQRAIVSTKLLDKTSLPEKIWFKQQFSIGVNDVTRVLERMRPQSGDQHPQVVSPTNGRNPSVHLQVILVASDCTPRWLTKHLPSLASSRKVPLIFVKDDKGGSLRLGELVKLKTAIAIGVKVKDNSINQTIEALLHEKDI